jgi:amidophosphoribosyltransferase
VAQAPGQTAAPSRDVAPAPVPSRRTAEAALSVVIDAAAEGKPRDHCGIVAVAAHRPVSSYLFYALQALQHRGQESAGMVTLDGLYEFRSHKGMGLVDQVFDPEIVKRLRGHTGIGHCRYSTSAGSTEENCQPQVVMGAGGGIALAHNGNIPNTDHLRDELQKKGWAFFTGNDTEVVVRLLANKLQQHGGNAVSALEDVMDRLDGAYCFTILIGGEMFAVRDPHGIKPLCAGTLPDGGHVVVSESVALDAVGATWLRDIKPGEIVRVTADAMETVSHRPAARPAHCFFEYVYFARGDSVMDGRLNQEVRENIGRILWRESPVEADLVVPVPDSGRSHANGLAKESGIPYVEALMKNRYVHRTFIMPTQETRELNVRLKLNPIRRLIEGKRVILVDDSIVRGTTMKRIVRMLRQAGAAEVHLRIGAPAIIAPCYLGIDMSTRDQLIAANKSVEEVREHVGADSLEYISIQGIVAAVGMPEGHLCLGCVNETYPVPIAGEKVRNGHVVEGPREEATAHLH